MNKKISQKQRLGHTPLESARRAVSDWDGSSDNIIFAVTTSTRRSSVRLEPEFHASLKEVCMETGMSAGQIYELAARKFPKRNRTSALKTIIMLYFRSGRSKDFGIK